MYKTDRINCTRKGFRLEDRQLLYYICTGQLFDSSPLGFLGSIVNGFLVQRAEIVVLNMYSTTEINCTMISGLKSSN